MEFLEGSLEVCSWGVRGWGPAWGCGGGKQHLVEEHLVFSAIEACLQPLNKVLFCDTVILATVIRLGVQLMRGKSGKLCLVCK